MKTFKNILAVLALLIIGTTLSLYTLDSIGFASIKPEVLRDLEGLCFIVVGYFFGSSIGSKEKTNLLNDKKDEQEKKTI